MIGYFEKLQEVLARSEGKGEWDRADRIEFEKALQIAIWEGQTWKY